MVRAAMFGGLWLVAGCLVQNPEFNDVTSEVAAASGGATSGATSTSTTTTTTTSEADAGSGTAGDTASTGATTTTGGDPTLFGCPDHPHLLACYVFSDEPEGVLADRSGNMLDFSRTAVSLVAGLPDHGSAGQFTDASQVQIGEHPAFDLDRLTISLLVLPTGANGQILDNDAQYGIRMEDGTVACTVVRESGEFVTVEADIEAGVWSHVFCSFDGERLALHVDDEDEGDFTDRVEQPGPLKKDAANGVTIGNENPAFDLPFLGLIDHVLVFGEALDDAERCQFDPFPCP